MIRNFVIDANILFSAFIKNGFVRRLLLLDYLEFHTPKYVIEEFFEHIDELADKTKLDDLFVKEKVKEFVFNSNLRLYSKRDIKDFLEVAEKISPDEDDVMYFALALKLNCPILSQDRNLKEQNLIEVYNLRELVDFLKNVD